MFRYLFVMVFTVVFGLGSGYFLWGTRVARLTEALNGMTLEIDTMRARLAAPRAADSDDPAMAGQAADQLRVINESLAAVREDLAEQKALMERTATAAVPAEAAAAVNELRRVRDELAVCIADKQDLELNHAGPGAAAAPVAAPNYAPPTPRYAPPGAAAMPPPTPRYAPPSAPTPRDTGPNAIVPPPADSGDGQVPASDPRF